jgi:hypothetical protein
MLTAGCIDTDPPAWMHLRPIRAVSLMQTVRVHHAMRVMSTETCCQRLGVRTSSYVSSLASASLAGRTQVKYRADERTRTADLVSLRVIGRALQGVSPRTSPCVSFESIVDSAT